MKEKLNRLKVKTYREGLLLVVDLFVVAISFVIAYLLTQVYILGNEVIQEHVIIDIVFSLIIILALCVIAFWLFGVFKVIWRNAKPLDYGRIFFALLIVTVIFSILDSLWLHLIAKPDIILGGFWTDVKVFPTYIIFFFISTLFLSIIRTAYQAGFAKYHNKNKNIIRRRTLIVGAGSTAHAILTEIEKGESDYLPVFALDDDANKQCRIFNGVEVVGTLKDIQIICEQYNIEVIIFAIPSMEKVKRTDIIRICGKTGCDVKVIPLVSDIIDNASLMGQMRSVDISDLLDRPQIEFEELGVSEYICGKTIMVTGGGGSIGSELCRQILKFAPKRIVIVEIYENCAYDIQQELKCIANIAVDFRVEILSVTDYDKLESVFVQYHPDIIYHAAAHKHVPLMETNPEEAVKNNVFGTYNTVRLAAKYEVKKFILISTDKAVNPTNVMGATKRCCEKILQLVSRTGCKTEFAAVRFGNVLGSNGSVIPLFKRQIAQGGPVTVTHKDIIRYFMTIPEAVSLVMQAGAFAKSGEIFVLDMGEQVKIVKLAENLIKALGFEPYKDIDIQFTGLRPGEKLYEELLMSEEGLEKTANNKIYIGNQIAFDDEEFQADLEEMREVCTTNDKFSVIEQLKILVPTFKHDMAQYTAMIDHDEVMRSEFINRCTEAVIVDEGNTVISEACTVVSSDEK